MVGDTQYFQPGKNLNPDDEGKTFFDTAEECKAYCELTYPDEAKFFSWNEAESSRKKNRLACRCKRNTDGERSRKGIISGNLFCDNPAPAPLRESAYECFL